MKLSNTQLSTMRHGVGVFSRFNCHWLQVTLHVAGSPYTSIAKFECDGIKYNDFQNSRRGHQEIEEIRIAPPWCAKSVRLGGRPAGESFSTFFGETFTPQDSLAAMSGDNNRLLKGLQISLWCRGGLSEQFLTTA